MRKLFGNLKRAFFGNSHQVMVNRWRSANGDKTLRLDYDLNEKSFVVDLGGFKGEWSNDILQKYNPRLFIFEPVHAYCEAIRKRFAASSNVQVYNYGLGSQNREDYISVTGDSSSIFTQSDKSERIIIRDVTEWLEEYSEGIVDLMKVNIEGAEYELLEKLIESKKILMIRNLQVQFHNFEKGSKKRMKRIQAKLAKTHTVTYKYEFVWENYKLIDPTA